MERTLILLKPDALHRGLIGRILARFEAKGLKIAGLKMEKFPKALIREHYAEHVGKGFYDDLVAFMTSAPVVAVILEGNRAIEVARRLIGATNSSEAAPGTIRGDLGLSFSNNLVHGSDGPAAAERELALFFPEEGIAWTPVTERWVYSSEEKPAAKKAKKKAKAKKKKTKKG